MAQQKHPPANSRLFVKLPGYIKFSSKQAFSGTESLFFYLSFLRKPQAEANRSVGTYAVMYIERSEYTGIY